MGFIGQCKPKYYLNSIASVRCFSRFKIRSSASCFRDSYLVVGRCNRLHSTLSLSKLSSASRTVFSILSRSRRAKRSVTRLICLVASIVRSCSSSISLFYMLWYLLSTAAINILLCQDCRFTAQIKPMTISSLTNQFLKCIP